MINRLAVIGVGLIGGSLARAMRERRMVQEIVGVGRDERNLQRAVELGVIDSYTFDFATAVSVADLVVVATTLGATRDVFRRLAAHLSASAIVTDVGSVKASVIEDARATLGPHFARFVPGHPIAGGEKSGVEAATADLFERHRVILTPVNETAPAALATMREIWTRVGATVSDMEASHHDAVLAATSHLPHVLAYALVDCLAGMSDSGAIFDFAAGGFRDFTRIASSNPDMWRDIALANRAALSHACSIFIATFSALQRAIDNSDGDALHAHFARAKQARDAYLFGLTKK